MLDGESVGYLSIGLCGLTLSFCSIISIRMRWSSGQMGWGSNALIIYAGR